MFASPALSAEARRLLALAWPVMLTGLNWTILQVTDIVVVGLAGTHQAAAFGASRAVTFPGIVIGLGALTGVLVHASRADGARDLPGTGRALHQGVLLALALGLAMGCALFAGAAPLLEAIGVSGEVAPIAAQVVRITALSYPAFLLIIAASFFLEGISRPRRVTVVNLAILPVNALLAWAMSGGHLGLPAMGAAGAALATTLCYLLGAIGMLAAAWTLPRARERGVRDLVALLAPDSWRGALALAKFGVVPAIASGLELVGFAILIALSTQLGDTSAHAFQIVFSVHNVTFAVALGLGSAAGVRAGNAVGEGAAYEAAWRTAIAAALAALATGLCALVLALAALPIVALFPATPGVHALAGWMLAIWAPFILFDGLQIVFVYALRSLGDQVATGINSILAYFVVTGGLGLLLVRLGWGPLALVLASGLGMVAAALLHGARLAWISRRFRLRS